VVGAPPNTVNFNVMSAQIASTTVFGGANRSSVINVGNGALTQLSGRFDLDLHGGTVNLNDQADTTARALQFSASQFTGVVQVDFTGVGTMTLNAGSGNDAIAVLGTPAGMSLTINADPGNDNVSLGDGNIDADLLGPVTVNGSAGTDSLTIDNHSDATSETQTLSAFDFIDSGVSYGFSGIDGTMTVNLGSGANNLTRERAAVPHDNYRRQRRRFVCRRRRRPRSVHSRQRCRYRPVPGHRRARRRRLDPLRRSQRRL
jgi:hypothetical protein